MVMAEQKETAPQGARGLWAASPPLSQSAGAGGCRAQGQEAVAAQAELPQATPGAGCRFTKASWPSNLQAGTSGWGSVMGRETPGPGGEQSG